VSVYTDFKQRLATRVREGYEKRKRIRGVGKNRNIGKERIVRDPKKPLDRFKEE